VNFQNDLPDSKAAYLFKENNRPESDYLRYIARNQTFFPYHTLSVEQWTLLTVGGVGKFEYPCFLHVSRGMKSIENYVGVTN
jgi:hypothetical protein